MVWMGAVSQLYVRRAARYVQSTVARVTPTVVAMDVVCVCTPMAHHQHQSTALTAMRNVGKGGWCVNVMRCMTDSPWVVTCQAHGA